MLSIPHEGSCWRRCPLGNAHDSIRANSTSRPTAKRRSLKLIGHLPDGPRLSDSTRHPERGFLQTSRAKLSIFTATLCMFHIILPVGAQVSSSAPSVTPGNLSSIGYWSLATYWSLESSADLSYQLTESKRATTDALTSTLEGSHVDQVRRLLANIVYSDSSPLGDLGVIGEIRRSPQLAMLHDPSLLGADCKQSRHMSQFGSYPGSESMITTSAAADFRRLVEAFRGQDRDLANSLSDEPLSLLYEIGVLAKRPEFHELALRLTDALWTCQNEVAPGARSVRGMALALYASLYPRPSLTSGTTAPRRRGTQTGLDGLTLLEQERRLYPRYKQFLEGDDDAPRLCLAMSGGGIRSAAFQVGVLQALADRGDLKNLDVVSAVSGGTFALSWYLNSFGLESKPLSEESVRRTLDPAAARLVTVPEFISLGFANLLAVPLSKLAQAARGRPLTYSLAHLNYGRLVSAGFGTPNYSMARLRQVLSEHSQMPYPVFAATARSPVEGPCGPDRVPRNLAEQVFELSPVASGTVARGLSSAYRDIITVRSASAISGSAFDTPYASICNALEGAGLRLGARLRFAVADEAPEQLYLSDGAFSDNLGIFPLLRRGCSEILVSDAEYDPHLAFPGYATLKSALDSDPSASLQIEEIDKALGEPCHSTPPAASEVPASRRAKHTAFAGTFSPRSSIEGKVSAPIPVTYLKLAVNREQEDLPNLVRDILDRDAQFPHIPTTNQHLSVDQFRALRHLGYYMACIARGGERDRCSNGPATRQPIELELALPPMKRDFGRVASSTAAALLADSLRACSAAHVEEALEADVAELSALWPVLPWQVDGLQEIPQLPPTALGVILAYLDNFSSDLLSAAEREEISGFLGELELRPVCTDTLDGNLGPPNADSLREFYWEARSIVNGVLSRESWVMSDDAATEAAMRHFLDNERSAAVSFSAAQSMLDNAEDVDQMRQIISSSDFIQAAFDIFEAEQQLGNPQALPVARLLFERWASLGRSQCPACGPQ